MMRKREVAVEDRVGVLPEDVGVSDHDGPS